MKWTCSVCGLSLIHISIQAPSQPDMRAQMQQQAEPATQQEATAAAPMAAAEAAKTSDAPVAEKPPEHSTAEPAEPPTTEAQDGEIPAVDETEAEQPVSYTHLASRSRRISGWRSYI